jgi:hypothetical protein
VESGTDVLIVRVGLGGEGRGGGGRAGRAGTAVNDFGVGSVDAELSDGDDDVSLEVRVSSLEDLD